MICLIPCVVSVWAPGSPFDIKTLFNSTIHDPFTAGTLSGALTARNSTVSADVEVGHTDPILYISVILLMTGIVAARFGKCKLKFNQILSNANVICSVEACGSPI